MECHDALVAQRLPHDVHFHQNGLPTGATTSPLAEKFGCVAASGSLVLAALDNGKFAPEGRTREQAISVRLVFTQSARERYCTSSLEENYYETCSEHTFLALVQGHNSLPTVPYKLASLPLRTASFLNCEIH